MSGYYLLATDGSSVSERAVNYVLNTYTPREDRILVLSVADESKFVPYLMGDEAAIGGVNLDEIRDQIEDQAEEAVQETTETLEEAGFEVQSQWEFGDPGSLICEVAREEDVDSVVMGRRGHSRVGELLLGSVSHYVVHHLDRPVTLIPDTDEGE
jgi:nucleotide-binding universal stress UspA family protein